MAESTSPNPPPRPPSRNHAAAAPPAWNQPTDRLWPVRQPSRDWSPYIVFGGITLLVGCLAILVTLLAH